MTCGTTFVRKACAAIDATADDKAKFMHWDMIEIMCREQKRKLKASK